MIEISINGEKHKLPETWQEVPAKQLPQVLRQLYAMPESGKTYHEIIRILLGYSAKQWTRLMRQFFSDRIREEKKQQSAVVLAEILRLQSWMWKDDLTIAPFESFKVDGAAGDPAAWYVFEEGFKSMTFGEMADAYIHAQAFIKQLIEGEERLNMLVAAICRPEQTGDYQNDPAWSGDKREAYNEHIARRRAKQIEGRLETEKVLVLMYFLGSVKNFFSYFDLFDTDTSKPPVPEEFPGQSMIKNQHLLAEKQIFGPMEKTKAANVHDVFTFLEEHRKDIKNQNERNKSKE